MTKTTMLYFTYIISEVHFQFQIKKIMKKELISSLIRIKYVIVIPIEGGILETT